MHFAQCMSILYRKGSVTEADVVSLRPGFFHPDDVHLRRLIEMFALRWDRNVHDLCCQDNYDASLVISADTISVDDDFLTKLKNAHSACSHLFDEKIRWKGHVLIMFFDGLY